MKKLMSLFLTALLVMAPAAFAQKESGYNGWTLGIESLGGLDDVLSDTSEALPLEVSFDLAIVSAYMWRGQKLGGDASYQPSTTITPEIDMLGSLSVNWWANWTQNLNEPLIESDITIDYTVNSSDLIEAFGGDSESMPLAFDFSSGYIYYYFPNSRTSTQEIYFGLAFDTILSPSMTWYHDWNQGSGEWIEFGISHDVDLDFTMVSTYATLGYNHRQWNGSNGTESGFATLDFGGSIPIAVGEHITVEPFLAYTKRLQTFRTAGGADLTEDELYGGVNFSLAI